MFMCRAIIVYNSFNLVEYITNLILLSKVEHNNIKVAVYYIEKEIIQEFGFQMNDCYI